MALLADVESRIPLSSDLFEEVDVPIHSSKETQRLLLPSLDVRAHIP